MTFIYFETDGLHVHAKTLYSGDDNDDDDDYYSNDEIAYTTVI